MGGRKGRIAFEFNTTTVYLYDAPGLGKPRQLECYARTGERMWGDVGVDVGGVSMLFWRDDAQLQSGHVREPAEY